MRTTFKSPTFFSIFFKTELSQVLQALSEKARAGTQHIQRLRAISETVMVSVTSKKLKKNKIIIYTPYGLFKYISIPIDQFVPFARTGSPLIVNSKHPK